MRHNKLIDFLLSFEVNALMLGASIGAMVASELAGYRPFFWAGLVSTIFSAFGMVAAREIERRNGR